MTNSLQRPFNSGGYEGQLMIKGDEKNNKLLGLPLFFSARSLAEAQGRTAGWMDRVHHRMH